MPYILDTDTTSILQSKNQPALERLQIRLSQHPTTEICTTIVSFHEQITGWTAFLNKVRPSESAASAYAELGEVLKYYCQVQVLAFNDLAQNRFRELRKQRVRIGTLDLRIAAIALTVGYTVVSRNLRDFRKVPGLVVEDWTQ